ncbi:MAG TPA: hypothetical protein ENN58_03510 [bacterium]|nr:hypothetical protein [bacterium]
MRYEIKKITKMIDEVTNYFLFNYRCNIKIDVIRSKDEYVIGFLFDKLHLDEKELKRLSVMMKPGRDPSLTNYYWQLTGEIEDDNELSLVAMMCDDVKIKQLDDGLSFTLIRKIIDSKKK